jgi:hypothetical protein
MVVPGNFSTTLTPMTRDVTGSGVLIGVHALLEFAELRVDFGEVVNGMIFGVGPTHICFWLFYSEIS